ncbi:hypothetical protein M670_00433 [Schinkia azotoformans MEV2011]|uniref:Uncharacterized protein n=1 Tax=Schinkia azotoformans MEV2011 TaxID=1348973 RepID=A0A072NT47_SCHAZ|nr:hypothetical protein [Schinkia azotoformans]KEF40407.1 hypothetical protein M670_00433 [Schinkia azotoformans MEV2011]MEC1696182.1 hypothetical protein [Schinkia azotoformans]MEC1725315.1 hypothetical protein [Schinkia azotoformans]MEC1779426.1 hypothetical protein [Schinkia azotoformans]MED4330089.1 hypothetical protein [Schinkia azotoformans]
MDSEALFAHIALHRFSIRPREFLEMERKEKAFMVASIKVELEKEQKEQDRIKKMK